MKKILFFLPLSYFLGAVAYGFGSNKLPAEENILDISLFLIQLSIIIIFAWLGGTIFRNLHLPELLGEIIAGVIIGPYALGGVSLPFFEQGIFPLQQGFPISPEVYMFSAIASLILLFFAGLETDIEVFLKFSMIGIIIGLGGVIVSFILGDLAGIIALRYILGQNYSFFQPVPLFLGVVSTATSVSITVRILSEKKKMSSALGSSIVSAAVIDDILGIIFLAVVMTIVKTEQVLWGKISFIALKAFLVWLAVMFLGVIFSKNISGLLKKLNDTVSIAVMSFACALFLSGVFEMSGLAMIIGAYVMGVILSQTDISFVIREYLKPLQRFFVPIFFCSMGMLVDLRNFFSFKILIFGSIYLIFSIISKIIGCGIPALIQFTNYGAYTIGVAMVPRGEIALIIASVGLASGIISQDIFAIIIVMTFITTLITPVWLEYLLNKNKQVLKKGTEQKTSQQRIEYKMPNEETGKIVLSKILSAFDSEGFYIYHMPMPREVIYQIRKDDIAITMERKNNSIIFHSQAEAEPLIHTLFYEVVGELEYTMKNLQSLADKAKIGKKIFQSLSSESTLKLGNNKIEINKIIQPQAVKASLSANTKEEVIEELVNLLTINNELLFKNKQEVIKEIMARENLISTGMQDGIALPHIKTDYVQNMVSAFGLKPEGIDFNSLDGKPAQIFILTLIPAQVNQPYLQYIAHISKILVDSNNRKEVLSCTTDEQLYNKIISLF